MRVVFMGTPDFAVPSLEALVTGGYQVVAVVTQPDRPKGRGQMPAFTPVKEAALAAGLEVLQPEKVREPWFLTKLAELRPDVVIVAAFGQILPGEVLDLPPFGCINVHASLLPKYRGAAPIHRCIINGEERTGVTIMQMDRGLDTGDMLLQAEIEIGPEDTAGTVHDRLAGLGGALLLEALGKLARGELKRIPQDHSQSSYAPMLSREDELIDWMRDNKSLDNLIRGMNPWPGAYTIYKGKIVKVWLARAEDSPGKSIPGTVVRVDKNAGFEVQTGSGVLLVREVQPQGGKRMDAAAFARGYALAAGDLLGQHS